MMHWYPNMMGWGSGIGMILFWIVIVVLIAVLIKWILSQSGGRAEQREAPLDVLKRRYASGEIDKEEFDRKKKELES